LLGAGAIAFVMLPSKVSYADNITCNNKTVQGYIGENINADCACIQIMPENTKEKPFFYSSNTVVATIGFLDGQIECLNEGSATITVSIKNSESTIISDTFLLVVSEASYSTNLYFEHDNLVILSTETDCQNIITFVGQSNFTPIVSYAVGGIVNYDYLSGNITPVGTGDEIVTVTIKTSATEYLSKSFNVNVVGNDEITPTVYNETVSVNQLKRFNFLIEATGMTNASVVTITSGNDYIELVEYDCSYIIVKGLLVGQATIEIVSANSRVIFVITITH